MVEGRSKQAFKAWLADGDQSFRDSVEVVTLNGFAGFKTAAEEELPEATAVMDPFHVVHLAGDAVEKCRRGSSNGSTANAAAETIPLYKAKRTLLTGADLITDRQHSRIQDVFDGD